MQRAKAVEHVSPPPCVEAPFQEIQKGPAKLLGEVVHKGLWVFRHQKQLPLMRL